MDNCGILNNMVLIPSGSFYMGVKSDETVFRDYIPGGIYLSDACPQRIINISEYYIDKYPVTNKQYKSFIDETGYYVPQGPGQVDDSDLSEFSWNTRTRCYTDGMDDFPVVFITWYDALAYCDWVGKRLPTEAEWEKAARGTDCRPYPWGWDTNLKEHCHVFLDSIDYIDDYITSVYEYPTGASPFGCYDMLGNVWEWCNDWYDEEYYSLMPDKDPKGPKSFNDIRGATYFGANRVCRGGGRFNPEPHLSQRCILGKPWMRDSATGFRCALSFVCCGNSS